MPEYVYALHDFIPEHEDEVEFHAGERIEVVEKDDLYGDGWWQGRNLAGKVGLFPKSYTAAAPPTVNGASATTEFPHETTTTSITTATTTITSTVLQPLAEESESESPISKTTDIVSPVPRQPPATSFLNVNGNGNDSDQDSLAEIQELPRSGAGDGEMMKATLTDVQKAIEQLGRNRADGDGGRSFSFASTRDGETDTDLDLSDVDGPDTLEREGEDWHKGAREMLAKKARQAVKDAERLEAMLEQRSTAPPIDVELSDESEDEGETDFTSRSTSYQRTHPYIPEEDEDDLPLQTEDRGHGQEHSSTTTSTVTPDSTAARSTTSIPSQTATAAPSEDVPEVTTATQPSFNHIAPKIEKTYTAPPPSSGVENVAPAYDESSKRNSAPTPISQPLSNLPSPTASTHASGFHISTPFQMTSASSTNGSVSTNPTSLAPTQQPSVQDKKERKHPNEWTLEEVVEWLKGKGFDQDVCDKFIEQEITGDVLLDLDVNLLKSEIGIIAFGKRVRISNAIAELRRPPSIASFERLQHAPSLESQHTGSHSPPSALHHSHILNNNPPGIHVHTRSLSHGQHSIHSYPGTPSYNQGTPGSLPSPIGYSAANGGPMSAPTPSDASQITHGTIATIVATSSSVAGAGTGIGLGIDGIEPDAGAKSAKGRPAQLMLSPSDGNLKSKVIIDRSTARSVEEEDRAHMSDGDAVAPSNSVRRRLFGRSHDSSLSVSNSSSRTSKDGHASPVPSPSQNGHLDGKEAVHSSSGSIGSRHRTKKSLDKTTDRLSIFGNTFVGKGRKPPPSEEGLTESKSSSMFSRLHGSTIRKSSSTNRPSTPSSSPKSSPVESKDRLRNVSSVSTITTPSSAAAIPDLRKKHSANFSDDRDKRISHGAATLRKRTISGPAGGSGSGDNGGATNGSDPSGEIKQGTSILEQVGEPDHTGWMRKKGVRYNSWKNRYCVLKGEHLYILRANSKSETRLKGYVNIHGYKVTVDENLGPGRYGFRIDHDQDKTHYFSSDEKGVIREWMKAIMKATIGRDYTKPVVSSCNIPTIPLVVAQAMNPAPRPPSPTARDATQKALRRENPHQLSSRDARVLMGLPGAGETDRKNVHSFFADESPANGGTTPITTPTANRSAPAPPRPSRDSMRRMNSVRSTSTAIEDSLIDWGNSHLPESLQVYDAGGPLFSGLALLRIAESIKGKPASPPVPDSAFPSGPSDDKLDGLFKLFDFLLDNDVKMGSVSINDVRQGKRDKILQLVKALKAWEDKRRALALSMGTAVQAGSFIGPVGSTQLYA